MESTSYTWAPTGADGVVIRGDDDKAGFTAVGTISAVGCQFPLVMIAVGKTTVSENNWFGSGRNICSENQSPEPLPNPFHMNTSSRANANPLFVPNSLTDHSSTGWTTLETWLNYLMVVRYKWFPIDNIDEFYQPQNTIILLADSYPAHFAKAAKRMSILLNIYMVKVPEGLTDLYQPLDTSIFGSVKSQAV